MSHLPRHMYPQLRAPAAIRDSGKLDEALHRRNPSTIRGTVERKEAARGTWCDEAK